MKFVFFVMIICSFFCGCNVKLKNMLKDNIAEIVDFVVCGEVDCLQVSLMCGKRECEYSLNGIAEELIPYGILTVYINDEDEEIKEVCYSIFVGVNKYEGIMKKNPYDNSLMADIKKVVDSKDNISVDIYINDSKYSTKLNKVDKEWIVNANMIINNILVVDYKEQVKYFIKDGEFVGEVYIKLIDDYDKSVGRYYYYVSIQGRDGSSMSLLISPQTAEVLASNLIETN